MKEELLYRPYVSASLDDCLKLFDANCPEYFAPNERDDYKDFLEASPKAYELCIVSGKLIAAFGVFPEGKAMGGDGREARNASLNWILIDPDMQGSGIGTELMSRALNRASLLGTQALKIAASHKSAPFFKKFGAEVVRETPDGWGPGMHRIDMVIEL
ncbi:GNAT family N-acetyltransferase [uncultured Pseudoteredinibacter sp.]|uniref:GNAT family N-acetyltransferase n=1 Tax=uncultured Pseudoteredinibacter sp. TaxID=1641701 RepID=UPI0026325651|nr:GNAT family N-acetyltransferase [uncultured Pseudoteredinibacter sp.]